MRHSSWGHPLSAGLLLQLGFPPILPRVTHQQDQGRSDDERKNAQRQLHSPQDLLASDSLPAFWHDSCQSAASRPESAPLVVPET